MKSSVRNVILVGGILAIVGSLGGFLATGMRPYTRLRDEALAQANQETAMSDLLAQTGATDAPPPPAADNVNALGLLPSGPGAASLSVLTIAGPGALAVLAVIFWDRRARRLAAAKAK